jgi:DNA-binding IclR family transcriptional regulator
MMKNPPAYAIASVDNALQAATMLQMEGELTVSVIADRLGVARSTAHRLLQMLVYRDFAIQTNGRAYRPGPKMELVAHSRTVTSQLRSIALPHLRRLVNLTGETANLAVRTGALVRFIASVESDHALRVGSREGMVFPAHRATAGLLLLAALDEDEVDALYAEGAYDESVIGRLQMSDLRRQLNTVRRNGFAVNNRGMEEDVVAVGLPVFDANGMPIAGLAVCMPEIRFRRAELPQLIRTLTVAAGALSKDFALGGDDCGGSA